MTFFSFAEFSNRSTFRLFFFPSAFSEHGLSFESPGGTRQGDGISMTCLKAVYSHTFSVQSQRGRSVTSKEWAAIWTCGRYTIVRRECELAQNLACSGYRVFL